ncbi:hypothetical protein KAU11_10595 [Candidatus Babeliales bacterium]|nr:hypothetical protein [Candidatus Babeliales bacterium]
MAKSDVLKLREEILNEIQEIGEKETIYITSGNYRPLVMTQRDTINIKTASSGALQDSYISTLGIAKAQKALGFEFNKHFGHSIKSWQKDMVVRAGVLRQEARLRTLNTALERVGGIMNDEEGREVGISDIRTLLG